MKRKHRKTSSAMEQGCQRFVAFFWDSDLRVNSSVSSPSNDANTTEEEDDMISKNGEDSDGGAIPSTDAQAPSPLKVKRERLAHLAEERRKKRRLV